MEHAALKEAVTVYIEAYNRFDVDGMLVPLHEEVVFRNIANGEVSLTTTGKEDFRGQAEQVTRYFSEREQRVTHWQLAGNRVKVAIDYCATFAMELPNGLKPGDTLCLQGKSVFRFDDGKIISIEDIS